jgi:hypothetical protein
LRFSRTGSRDSPTSARCRITQFSCIIPIGAASLHARIEVELMKTYAFDVFLKDTAEINDNKADALFAAGCDDGTPTCCHGQAWIHFDREAGSLEQAIRTAISQVQSVGFVVSKVELDAEAAVSLGS